MNPYFIRELMAFFILVFHIGLWWLFYRATKEAKSLVDCKNYPGLAAHVYSTGGFGLFGAQYVLISVCLRPSRWLRA